MDSPHPLQRAIAIVGLTTLARHLAVTHQAIRKWEAKGRMPRTEWTGETAYSQRIADLTAQAVTREQLLAPWPAAEQQAA